MKSAAWASFVSSGALGDQDPDPEPWPLSENERIAGGPQVWNCTNCGKETYDVVHEEGDQTICIECWERFEANEPRHQPEEI